ncbi:uncharacterized protein [Clytia hemisphaerica]|uniref:uncharacterized protein n=1 Tax=Clytia hemisphaerica TaxID=252671 RepID=UPI0034D627F4
MDTSIKVAKPSTPAPQQPQQPKPNGLNNQFDGQMLCTHSPISYNVTLKGGTESGNFTDLGGVDDMDLCISLCCEIASCQLAFMIGKRCLAVQCYTEELCQTIKAKPNNRMPKIAYIRRKENHQKTRDKLSRPLPQPSGNRQVINANHIPEKLAPVLRPSTCQARKIYNNVTLLGGMRAGNYTALGRATHLEDCIGRACDLNEGHLALMLGRYCYSVTCNNQRTCQTIPAKPSHLRPKVAYLAWTQDPIEQDTITNMAESDFFVNHKRYPRCKRSHIMYNHTLRGGLRAGNFSMLATVDDIEVCAALCCEEKYCDLALMIGDNCYAGDCTSPELCSAVPVPPDSLQRSQIAYITAPGRTKAEDKTANSDWSYIYLVVSALVIGISTLGTAWTICLCALKRHRRHMDKLRSMSLAESLQQSKPLLETSMKGNYLFGGNIGPVGTSSRNDSNINTSNISDVDEQDNNKNGAT